MIKLYLVRHGETEGNQNQWFQGAADIPLNETGLEQARRLSDFMKDIHEHAFAGLYDGRHHRCAARSHAGTLSGAAGNQLRRLGTPHVR